MDRVPRALRAGESKSASSRLRLVLLITISAICAMLIAGTSVGRGLLASIAGLLTGGAERAFPGGAILALIVAGAAVLSAIVFIRRRGKRQASPVLRGFGPKSAQTPKETDPLRRMRGRRGFLAELEDKLKTHAEEGRQLAVHRLDIDGFRNVNHAFGDDAGETLLHELSRRLTQLVGDAANLARLGDDEFAIIQPETGGAKHAEIFAARIAKAVEEPLALGGSEILVTGSIGIAVAPEHGPDALQLLRSADLALLSAKQAGRAAIRFFTKEMEESLDRRRSLERAVRQALHGDGLVLRYRPEYDLGTRRLLGFEVQVRLEDPAFGVIEESEFGPVAEDAGLLPAIFERAVRDACRTAGKWPQHLRIAFNLMPGHLASGDLVRILSDALKANHLSPKRVDLEVAEEIVSAGREDARDRLHRLAAIGFRLVLDNYGSGHCSPHDLWRHSFSAVKIDAGLVRRLGTGEGAEPLVGAMIKLGQALTLDVIADGADRVEQVHFLMLNGCRNVVGPVFGPAVAADKVAALIEKDMRAAAPAGDKAKQISAAA